MTAINQRAFGSHNNQTVQVFNRPLDIVDICADKIGPILARINSADFVDPPEPPLIPPDIARKHAKNKIDEANAEDIERTYAIWSEIRGAIGADASGELADNYKKATFLLNQLYLAKFQCKLPEFKIHVVSVYCQSTGANSDDAYIFVHLLNYMYLNCHVGISP